MDPCDFGQEICDRILRRVSDRIIGDVLARVRTRIEKRAPRQPRFPEKSGSAKWAVNYEDPIHHLHKYFTDPDSQAYLAQRQDKDAESSVEHGNVPSEELRSSAEAPSPERVVVEEVESSGGRR